MIKDRVIQKRIKGKVLAMAMTAVMASFFVPLGVEAADDDTTGGSTSGKIIHDINSNSDLVITASGDWNNGGQTGKCFTQGNKCVGHIIRGTGTATTNNVTVQGGTHDITLENVNIDVRGIAGKAAFQLEDHSARVNLTLSGTSTLKSGNNRAGLSVPTSSTDRKSVV